MERNHLDNFGRVPYEEHLCEVILNLGQWFRRCYLKKKFTEDARSSLDEDRSQKLTLS